MRSWSRSKAYYDRAMRSVGGGVSSGLRAQMKPHPLFFDSGAGSRLWDVDGQEYIDFVLGWGPLITGHAHPAVVEAVQEQVGRTQLFGAGHPLEFTVAEKILARLPQLERILWSNTGTEAVQAALRLARAHTGRNKILKFAGAYHGWQDSALISYRGLGREPLAVLNSAGQNPHVLQDMLVATYNDSDGASRIIEGHAEEIAAIIVEPVLANSGLIDPAPDFLRSLRGICDRHGIVLIFDEVITGFRIAAGGAVEKFGVRPDLAVYGKALGGGFSLSAVAGRSDIVDLVARGAVHAGTYNGNPVVLAAASATLDVLGQAGIYGRMEEVTRRMEAGIRHAVSRHGGLFSVHRSGPMLQMLPRRGPLMDASEYESVDWALWDELSIELLARGVFVLPGGRMFLSTAHTEDDTRKALHAFDASLESLALRPQPVE